MDRQELAGTLWKQVVERLKSGEMNRPLWRALDAAVPVTVDGTTLVVGFDTMHQHESSFLQSPTNEPLIDKVLAGIATKPLTLLVIDGTTPDDYRHYQQREETARQQRERAAQEAGKRDISELMQPSGGASATPTSPNVGEDRPNQYLWNLHREMHQRYIATPHHSLTQPKAQFLLDALPEMLEAERRLERMEPDEEQRVRLFSRALERLADIVDVNAIVVAAQYERYKRRLEE